MSLRLVVPALILTTAFLAPGNASGQAYCALRDPAPQIYSLFPQADNFRSHVGAVDDATRVAVSNILPFALHARELGQHTLYVAQQGKVPVGFVHVRSEPSDWGLVEIAWSLDLQGRVLDYRLQRCRGVACQAIARTDLKSHLAGRSLSGLRSLLTDDGTSLDTALLARESAAARKLAAIVVRSAAKTTAVTQVVWPSELHLASTLR